MPLPAKMRCRTCNAQPRNLSNWNGVYVAGDLVGLTCPKCQTPQEDAASRSK